MKVPYLGVLQSNKNGRSGLLGMEMERRWDERKWNQKKTFNLATLK